ncbi:MAG: hypothetical protein IIZ78_29120 [Clostridiales bacterium]|nr:hypothetical protein [Clostridiales bacterium]
MDGQMNIFDFLPDPNKKPEPTSAPIQYYDTKQRDYICQHSGHSCNKKNLWEVADSLDDTQCPHICCRLCSTKGCGARCNGSQEPRAAKRVILKGICDDAYCPECGEALDETKDLDCECCPECGTLIDWTPWHRMNDHYTKAYRNSCPYFIGAVPYEGKRDDPETNKCNCKDDGAIVSPDDEWLPCNPDRCPKHKMEVGII